MEHEKDFVFQMQVPGFAPSDVQLKVDAKDGVVTFSGKRSNTKLHREASFEHSFTVSPNDFDLSAATTSVEHGVASVTIPKKVLPPPPAPTDAPAVTTTTSAAEVAAPTAAYEAAAKMSWPPKFTPAVSDKEITFSCALPPQISSNNVDVHLDHGALLVTVRAMVDTEKKDSRGNVVYHSTRSLQYTTPLEVPRGTRNEDVSAVLDQGKLVIKVAKRATPNPAIKVESPAS